MKPLSQSIQGKNTSKLQGKCGHTLQNSGNLESLLLLDPFSYKVAHFLY
jgi:hypothetical protein